MKDLPVNQILCGDAFSILPTFPNESIDLIMFSPPYWGLRDYGIPIVSEPFAVGGLGLETHPKQYIERMVVLCRLLKRVLKKTGSMYLVLGDTYFGSLNWSDKPRPRKEVVPFEMCPKTKSDAYNKIRDGKWLQPKQKLMIPARVAIALQEDGWILRNDIIWYKPNHMPSSVKDRLTTTYEHIFHFVKSRRYYYDLDAIRIPHKDIRDYKRHAPFNYRVREAKKGHFGIIGVKASKDEMERYDNKGQLKTEYPGKFDGFGLEAEKFGSPRARTQRVIKIGTHHGSSLTKGRATHYEGQLIDAHPLGKNPGDTWIINTKPFPEAHFAVYPEEICIRPIKSSCPQWICKKCGKPRTRITKVIGKTVTEAMRIAGCDRKGEYRGQATKNYNGIQNPSDVKRRILKSMSQIKKTVGWSDCGCGAGFEPGIVLDPMCGSGTTLIAAHKLGRRWIGIELNPNYVEMAKRRIKRECSEWLTKYMAPKRVSAKPTQCFSHHPKPDEFSFLSPFQHQVKKAGTCGETVFQNSNREGGMDK